MRVSSPERAAAGGKKASQRMRMKFGTKGKNQKGLSLIALIIVLLVLGTIAVILSRLMATHQETVPLFLDTTRAFYAAQGGVWYVGKYLKDSGGNDWTAVSPPPNQPIRLGKGSFSVAFAPVDADHLTATIIGSSGAAQRQIIVHFEKTTGSALAVRSLGAVVIGSHAVLDCDPSSPTHTVCTQANALSCPCLRQNVPPAEMPALGPPSPHPPIPPGGCTINSNRTLAAGTYFCASGLIIGNNVRVNLAGPVTIFTTSFELRNNALLNQTGSAADLLIVAQGAVALGNNSQMKGAVYAPGFDVTVQNNANFTGTISGGGTVNLDNNSTFNFDDRAGRNTPYYPQAGSGAKPKIRITEWQE